MTTTTLPPTQSLRAAWFVAALAGFVLPALALLLLDGARGAAGAVPAVGMMGAGMIAGAVAGRLWVGVALALLAGAGLVLLARGLGLPALLSPQEIALALVIASLSFAARGALFARSAGARGWWIALGVVGGEIADRQPHVVGSGVGGQAGVGQVHDRR